MSPLPESFNAAVNADVTVLVRSMDRPSLRRAVLSALEQQGPRVSVVVIAAHGGAITQLDELRSDPRVRVVEPGRPLMRSAAANAGLAQLESPFALFLDDDDWLLAGHLQRLCEALDPRPDAVAAHTGVRCLAGDPAAPRTVHVFEQEADWATMQMQNLLPIHSVLFRTEALAAAPRLTFDEGLDHFEDWDFWLRLMARGPLVHVPGVSAVYWLDDAAGSGHAVDGAGRHARLASFASRQLQRWTADDVVALIDRHVDQVQHLNSLDQQVAARQVDIANLRTEAVAFHAEAQAQAAELSRQFVEASAQRDVAQGHVDALSQEGTLLRNELAAHRREVAVLSAVRVDQLAQIQRLDAQVSALLNSSSWRMTAPLRKIARLLAWLRAGRLQRLLGNCWRLFRSSIQRHGWRGVVRRLPFYLSQIPRYARELSRPAPTAAVNPFAVKSRTAAASRLHPEIRGTDQVLDASVSVVIPTLNGGDELVMLVRKLRGQRAVREVEIVIIDSGSTDGSHQRARDAGARVIEIEPSAFSHSHARNLGAEHATGDYLLFMVQDAYPVGDLWLYGMLRYLLDHREERVVAASCAEYCRSDSDAMYDSMVNTHYRFLGCLDNDRIGHHVGDDHTSLRTMGQLSDVACLIPRDVFMRYRYRGDYAEDLDLGIRLIRDGHRIAMLASVKVVHSHYRPAWYYLKRSFVDVIFLVGLFNDFHCPPCRSVKGLVAGIRLVAQRVAIWMAELARVPDGQPLTDVVKRWLETARHWSLVPTQDSMATGDSRMAAFLDQLWEQSQALAPPAKADAEAVREAQQFVDGFIARLDHFNRFAEQIYRGADERLRREYAGAIEKTLAATIGSALAYLYLDRKDLADADSERQWATQLFHQLKAGV